LERYNKDEEGEGEGGETYCNVDRRNWREWSDIIKMKKGKVRVERNTAMWTGETGGNGVI
jgi:hypothetical protein